LPRGDAASIKFRLALNVNARASERLRGLTPIASLEHIDTAILAKVSEQVLAPAIQRAIALG